MNSKIILAALFVLILQTVCPAQYPTHFSSHTKDHKVEIVCVAAKGPDRRIVINTSVFRTQLISFIPSAKGKMIYLEILEFDPLKEYKANTSGSYSTADINIIKEYGNKYYDPKRIISILHVCDSTGMDLHIVPIPETFTSYSSYACFYGENYVGLQTTNRWFGAPSKITFISLKDKKMFELSPPPGGYGFSYIAAVCLPDGKRLICQAHDAVAKVSYIYLNGIQIYPYYSTHIPDNSLHPDQYKQVIAEQNKWLKDNPGEYKFFWHEPENLKCWSPDSRYFVFWRFKQPQLGEAAQTDDKERDLQFVVFDTDNITSGMQVSDYTTILDAGVKLKDINKYNYDVPKVVWDNESSTLYFLIENSKRDNRTT